MAYAALVSLMHILDNLRLHPRPPISLHPKPVKSLIEKVTFLQEFLEKNGDYKRNFAGETTEADLLESRIADAAYEAEDIIESHIVDQIMSDGEKINSKCSYEAVEKVIEKMALIEREAMDIKDPVAVQHHQLHGKPTPRSSSIAHNSSMVGADVVLLEMKNKLTSNRLGLQIVPIVGMGGTGKTTLARNIYEDPLIKEKFDIYAWATISQEYSTREMLKEVLGQSNQDVGRNLSENDLGERLHKQLFGRKYLIIMDDIWNIEAWDSVKRFLPDNNNGSRIVLTTRLSNLASTLPNSDSTQMKLLGEVDSWNLLSKTVFGEEGCPVELEEIGKEIAKSCKGLPLSIVTVGGFLAKSEHTRERWEHIEENFRSIVTLEDDERCLRILHMSYKQLPIYLKPCFLYMGVFPEDEEISTSMLIKLWVAEGFLKAVLGESLEETAKRCLEDLISRNLLFIDKLGETGNIRTCKIHDLLRDLCLREAERERFYAVVSRPPNPQGIINGQRRIVISKTMSKDEAINVFSSVSQSQVRSLIWNSKDPPPPLHFRLLRIFNSSSGSRKAATAEFLENVHQLVNSRFFTFWTDLGEFDLRCSIRLFWNLQTLIVTEIGEGFTAPTNMWYMPHIRHLRLLQRLRLPDLPNGQDDDVLENLQTLGTIMNFKCSNQVVKRISNIKTLKLRYDDEKPNDDDRYGLSRLGLLGKLESLRCYYVPTNQINFPDSLKKLTLTVSSSTLGMSSPGYWDDMLAKIGVLPLLEKLRLVGGFFTREWKISDDQFPNLKYLALESCKGLHVWTTESSHFPCLERLVLIGLKELEEIPLDIADLPKLETIEVIVCSYRAVESAKRILEEQEGLHGEEGAIQVRVMLPSRSIKGPKRLNSPNYHLSFMQN